MKTAHFKYQETYKGKNLQPIYGTVTLKNDGKVSISLQDAKAYSAATRFQAKKLANEIVKADFNHPAVIELKCSGLVDATLAAVLTDKTQDLKAKWIEKTKIYCDNFWIFAVKQLARPMEAWYKEYKVETTTRKDYKGEDMLVPVNHKNDYFKMLNRIDYLKGLIAKGKAEFVKKEVKIAEKHYAACIEKLVDRLTKKSLTNPADIRIMSGWVGVNLNMTFEHNGITTKAWTIIAEGEVQRSHYRFLVK